jgi:hypothetical protein
MRAQEKGGQESTLEFCSHRGTALCVRVMGHQNSSLSAFTAALMTKFLVSYHTVTDWSQEKRL